VDGPPGTDSTAVASPPAAPNPQADQWEAYTQAGMNPDSATALVKAGPSVKPADAWEHMVNSGVKADDATALVKQHIMDAPPADQNVDAGESTLSQLGHRYLAQARTFAHGAISMPANTVGLPAAAGALLSKVPSSIGFGAPNALGAVLSKEGQVLKPLQDALTPSSTTLPVAKPDEMGFANWPRLGKLLAGVTDAAGGAAAGYGAGVAASPIAKLADPIAGAISKFGGGAGAMPAEVAAPVNRALTAAGTTPGELLANPPDRIADVIPHFTRAVRTVGLGPATTAIDAPLQARAAGQVPAIQSSLEDALGVPRGSATQSILDIAAKQKAAADPAYALAHAAPDITDPGVLDILRRPAFVRAYGKAQDAAIARGETPPPDLLPSGVPIPEMLQGHPEAEAAFRAAYLKQNPQTLQSVSVKTIDQVKKSMNALINSQFTSGDNDIAFANKDALKDLLARVDATTPAYAAARAQYAGHSELIDAAKAGAEWANPGTSAADMQRAMADMGPSELHIAKSAYADKVLAKAENAGGSAEGRGDATKSFYSSIGGRAKLQAAMPSGDAGAKFHSAMLNLGDQAATRNVVTGGSNTAEKEAGAAALRGGESPVNVGDLARTLIAPRYGLAKIGGKLANRALTAQEEQAAAGKAQAIAPYLMHPDVTSVLRQLAGHFQRGPMFPAAGVRQTGAVTGLMGAAPAAVQGLFGSAAQ